MTFENEPNKAFSTAQDLGVFSTAGEPAPAGPPSEPDDSQRINGLRKLCGYVENGTDTVVTIFQDDTTRDWIVKVGKYYCFQGKSMTQAVDVAIGAMLKGEQL